MMANKQRITDERARYLKRAKELAAMTTGEKWDRCYIVRNMLVAEFGIRQTYALWLARAALADG